MNRYPRIGEAVRILNSIGDDLANDRVGVVVDRDGEYVLIQLDMSEVLVERYPCELEPIEA